MTVKLSPVKISENNSSSSKPSQLNRMTLSLIFGNGKRSIHGIWRIVICSVVGRRGNGTFTVHGGDRMGIWIPQRSPRMRPFVKSAANTDESRVEDKQLSTPTDPSEDVLDGKAGVEEAILVELEFSGVLWQVDTTSYWSTCSRPSLDRLLVSRRVSGCLIAAILDSASRFPAITATLASSLRGILDGSTYVSLAEQACLGFVFFSCGLQRNTMNLNQFARD